ncbi:hypothetical protein AGOR_G00074030 [Albula goreensis]|uniref:Neurogenic mastermind-like N-terminal domain-containing protein n=1 Tax=Albula goreensis TaxID=1534307 RepID=A0A8T3DT69_9TELE|nr:hypothetical protein AGOR_G00074030 [Albula goreensis]
MMADFVVPRHSAVMERLRRRIELFRRHHTSCENRYDNTAMERLEMDQQQTFALHQRCLQTKAKRSNKHRQPPPPSDQTGIRGTGTGSNNSDPADAVTAESRNSTLIALQESVKRKLETSSSPLGREQNGFRDGYPISKKACLEDALSVNGTANGTLPPLSPMDTKHGVGADVLAPNGARTCGSDQNGTGLPDPGHSRNQDSDQRVKELKQEPVEDILPCMLPSGGSMGHSSLFPDLNLNEQEWKELMEELSGSVAYEDMQDIFNDGFEDRKDPELATTSSLQGPLPSADPVSVKAEFSPAFEPEPPSSSPQVRTVSSVSALACGSPATTTTNPSPSMPQSQPPSRLPQSLLLPSTSPKDLSPAQQLQQLAAREQHRAQLMQTHLTQAQQQVTQAQIQKQQQSQPPQQQQQQQQAKFHTPNTQSSWSQATPSQSPLGGAFNLEKPSSPALYQQDFTNTKQMLMPAPPNKSSPKAGAGPYMQPGGHPSMLSHPSPNTLAQNPAGGQPPMLDYTNTKPLSHYDGAQGPQGPPTSAQNKAALLSLIRQQQPMKPKAGLPFRPHLPHAQDQNAYTAGPHIPGPPASMATQPPGNTMTGNHGNPAYRSGPAAALKQQQQQHQQQQQQMQMIEQQKQFLLAQRQQHMMAEQEKQRQQEQQLQRHLTRPPPQYQDQQNSQNPFQQQQQQQQVNQFTGSAQPLGTVGLSCGSTPGGQRMFPSQSMMGMGVGQSGGPTAVVPPAASQADMVTYNNMTLHPHPGQTQRQPGSTMSAAYRQNQNLLAQQHLKNQAGPALLKQQQQQLARVPNAMPNAMPSSLPNTLSNSLPSTLPSNVSIQGQSWQQHQGMPQAMGSQVNAGSGGLQAFSNPTFHGQARLPKLPGTTPFSQSGLNSGRPLAGMNSAQMMGGIPQQRTNSTLAPQQHPQPLAPPPQQPSQPLAPPPQQSQQVIPGVNLPDLSGFSQAQSSQMANRASLQCSQGYPVNRAANQDLPFGYSPQSGNGLPSFPGNSDLMDTLLKNQTTQDWMDDLDELLANHQ